MPLYEYTCNCCSNAFEELSSSSETVPCPKCGTIDTERVLFSRVSVGKAGSQAAPSPCGRCGDPRGPGGCAMN